MSAAADHTPLVLCILDGIGLNPEREGNAVSAAHTPNLDRLLREYPHETLLTSGEAVGLPAGQMGNSEVGHLNIGAGRVVKQSLLRITDGFRDGSVSQLPALSELVEQSKADEAPLRVLHLVGLWSRGGVHSHLEHLSSLLPLLCRAMPEVTLVLHLVSDGRDVSPHAFLGDIDRLEEVITPLRDRVEIGSLSGRFYAMDRDNRWERTALAYEAIVGPNTHESFATENEQSEIFSQLRAEVQRSYDRGVTDEFLEPIRFTRRTWGREDGVLFWNFRADRMRQIVKAFTQADLPEISEHLSSPNRTVAPPGRTLCFTEYDETFSLPILFPPEEISHHLGEVLSQAGLTQLRVAETEKYPHVTYFFNGGEEQLFEGEERIVVPSPRDVKTYDEKPSMSARGVTEVVCKSLKAGSHHCIIVNFANGDMVGHTGNFSAAVEAVEVVDRCLGEILGELERQRGTALIIADHGNAEQMIDPTTGAPHTAHTTFPVPVILVTPSASERKLRQGGALCDVAPTILELLKIAQPPAMTGRSLVFSES
ncbi:2,3-bisphosphoglycerate-independent phosphoglycerate mutase [bacterium]|nr:2,3-bisphosphoglycerate-independent phosphoglycerate mutase [bacterium]